MACGWSFWLKMKDDDKIPGTCSLHKRHLPSLAGRCIFTALIKVGDRIAMIYFDEYVLSWNPGDASSHVLFREGYCPNCKLSASESDLFG